MRRVLSVKKKQHVTGQNWRSRNGRMQHDSRPCCQDWPRHLPPHLPPRLDTLHLSHHIHLRRPCRRALHEHHQHLRRLLNFHQFSLLTSRFSTSGSGGDAGLTTPQWLIWPSYHNPSS